jgi:hypothetical protein
MMTNEWQNACRKIAAQFKRGAGGPLGYASSYLALVDEGGVDAAQALYQSSGTDRVLTAPTSAGKHAQLAEWVMYSDEGRKRFARLRAIAWRRIMTQRLRDVERAARQGDLVAIV